MELSLHHTGAAQSRSVATDPRQREYRDRESLRTIQKTKSRKSKEGHKRQKKVRMQAGAYIGNQFLSEDSTYKVPPALNMAPGVKAARITCIPIGLRFDS